MTIIITAESSDWEGFPQGRPALFKLGMLCYLTSTCKNGFVSQGGVSLEIDTDFPFGNGDEGTSVMEIKVY